MSELVVAIYARVSSDQQAEAGTIASQIGALQERLEQDGFVVAEELTFVDEGYSGASLIRPGLERLRDVVALQGIDRLYVCDPDRLARKYAYQVLLMDEFQRAGVAVVLLNRAIGDSPEDDLLLQVQGMIAEYERAKILERSRRGKRHAARSGDVAVLGGAPYGFHYVTKQEGDGQARYEIALDEARVVRQIYAWIGQERLTIGEVCRRLQKAGERTRTGRTTWDRMTILGILRNPAYKGQAAYGKTKEGPMQPKLRPQRGDPAIPKRPKSTRYRPQEEWIIIPVPALVSESLFDAVQHQLDENRQRARQRKRGASYLLQGLIVCAQCGYAFYGKPVSNKKAKEKPRRYAYYRCIGTDAYRFGGERICHNHQVRTDTLDQAVWKEVCHLLADTQRLEEEYQRRLNTPAQENTDLKIVESQLAKVRRSIARLIDSYTEEFIEKAEFEPRIQRLRQRITDLENKAQSLADEANRQAQLRLVITRLEDFAGQVKDGLATADWNHKRDLIRTMVQRVEIGQEDVNVVFRIPPDPFESRPNGGVLQHCRNCNVAALCDILDTLGHGNQAMHHRLRPLLPDMYSCGFVGRARTVRWMETDYRVDADPYGLEIDVMDDLQPGDVVVHSTDYGGTNAPWGELMSTVAKQRGAVGCVCDSQVRDVVKIIEMGFPVYYAGIRPLDSQGRGRVMDYDVPVRCGDVLVHPGELVIADFDGIVVIPREAEAEVFQLARERVSKENQTRSDLLIGKSLREVYDRYGVL